MRRFGILIFALAIAPALLAQSTTALSTGVVDTDGFAWTNGSYQISFVPSPSWPSPNSYQWSGGNLQQNLLFNGTLNGSGAWSQAGIPSSSAITPSGSQWQITICPNATTGCFSVTIPLNGSTEDVTSILNASAQGPRFRAASNMYGYGTVEVDTQPKQGFIFFNTTNSSCQQWGTSGWQSCGQGVSLVSTAPQQMAGPLQATYFTTGPAGKVLGTFAAGTGPLQQSIDAQGNIWVASLADSKVREISPLGTVLNTFSMADAPDCAVVDGAGNIWLCNQSLNKVTVISPTGSVLGTHATGAGPDSIAFDQQGRVWITNSSTTTVTVLQPNGTLIGTYQTGGNYPYNVVIDSAGNAWVDNFGSGTLGKISPLGALLGVFTVGTQPQVMAFDQTGNLWVPNQGSNSLMKVSPAGVVLLNIALTTVSAPGGLAIDGAGNIWIYGGSNVAEYSNSGLLLGTYTAGSITAYASIDRQGNLWLSNYGSNTITEFSTGSVGVLTPAVLALGQQTALLNEAITTFGSPISTTFGQDVGVQNGTASLGLWENGSGGSSIGGYFVNADMLLGFGSGGTVLWSYAGTVDIAVGPTGLVVESCTTAGCVVPANGIQFPAWSQTLPTIGCGSGTATTIVPVVRVSLMGKTANVNVVVTDTTNGSCATYLTVPMPFTAKTNNALACYLYTGSAPNSAIGYMTLGGTSLFLFNAAGGYPAGTGYTVQCDGTVETQ